MSTNKEPPPIVGFSVLCQKELTALCATSGGITTKREIAFRGAVQLAALAPHSLVKYPAHAARFAAIYAEDADVTLGAIRIFREAVLTPKTAKAACCAMLTLNWIGDMKPMAYMEGWARDSLRAPPKVETLAHECSPLLLWSENVRVPYFATTALDINIQEMRDLWAREWHRRYVVAGNQWDDLVTAQLNDSCALKTDKDHAKRVHKLRHRS